MVAHLKNVKKRTSSNSKSLKKPLPKKESRTKPALKRKKTKKKDIKKEEKPEIKEIKEYQNVQKVPYKKIYYTNIDRLYEIIEQQGKITFKDISKKFNVPLNLLEEWVNVLNKKEMITIQYPLTGDIILLKKGYVNKNKSQKKKKKEKLKEAPKKSSEDKPKRKVPLLLITIIFLIFILLILFIILIKGGYLVIE